MGKYFKRKFNKYAGIASAAYGVGSMAYSRFAGRRSPAAGAGRIGKRVTRKTRSARSYTRTKTRSKTKNVGASAAANSVSYFTQKTRTTRVSRAIWKTISTANGYRFDSSGRLEANNGEQAATYVTWLDTTAASTLMNNAGVVSSESGKIYMQGMEGELMFTNQDSGNCKVTLYDVVCRRDTQESDLIDIWDDGLKENQGSTGNTRSVNNLGTTPFESSEFCSKFKVLRTTNVQMCSGQSHTHKVRTKMGFMLSRDVVDDFNYFHGVSFMTIMVVHSMPYNAITTQTQVAVGDAAISWVKTHNFRYRSIVGNDRQYGYSKGQSTFTTAENVMNIIGDAIPDEEA